MYYNTIKSGYNNHLKYYARDDCSGFVMNVLKGMNINVDGLSSNRIMDFQDSICEQLLKSGYEMYVFDINKKHWNRVTWNFEINDYKVDEGYCNFSIKDIAPGDMLVSPGHIEFYIGYEYDNDYINAKKENGTTKRQDIINEDKKNGILEIERKNRSKQEKFAYNTFGWGGVHDEYPLENKSGQKRYFYMYDNEGYFRYCECGETNHNIWKYKCERKKDGYTTYLTQEEIGKYNAGYVEGDFTEENANKIVYKVMEAIPKNVHNCNGCRFNEYIYSVIWRRINNE